MRISAVTVMAFSAVLLTGCGGAISACTKVAVKAGSSTAVKTSATKSAAVGLAAGHAAPEGIAAATGRAAEGDVARVLGAKPSALGVGDDAGRAGIADDAGRASGESEQSTAEKIGEEVGQEAIQQLPDIIDNKSSDDDREHR